MIIVMQRTINIMTPEQLKEFAGEYPEAERKIINEEPYYIIQ
jgi:hypothetical protein